MVEKAQKIWGIPTVDPEAAQTAQAAAFTAGTPTAAHTAHAAAFTPGTGPGDFA